MKKYIVVMKILVVVMILAMGFWIGMITSQQEVKDEAGYMANVSTTVAVVNQDLGVLIDGKNVNYANAVIETLGDGYIVVSAAVALSGIEEGIYGAIITFPTSFSENIISINTTRPNQAIMGIMMNPRLPEDKYVRLYTQLLSMRQEANNNVAYAYTESVFNQLHLAQDEVDELLRNDEIDMQAVSQVTLADYTARLELGDIPDVELSLTSPDYAGLLTDAQNIADDMNRVYVDSYSKAQEDFGTIQEQIAGYESEITSQSDLWSEDMKDWSDDVFAYAKEVSEYKDSLDEWRKEAVRFYKKEVKLYNALKEYSTQSEAFELAEIDMLDQTKLIGWRDDTSTLLLGEASDIDGAISDAETVTTLVSDVNEAVSQYNQAVNSLIAWNDYLNEYKKYLDGEIQEEPSVPEQSLTDVVEVPTSLSLVSDSVTELNTKLSTVKTNLENQLSALPQEETISQPIFPVVNRFPRIVSNVPDKKEIDVPEDEAPVRPQELVDALSSIVSTTAGFNPDDYFDEQTKSDANKSIAEYSGYLQNVERTIDANDAENRLVLNDAYNTYNSHVCELRSNIYDVHNTEQGILSDNITKLSEVLISTSNMNHGLMDSFVSLMPNSRIRSTVNQYTVQQTVTPITYSYNYIRDSRPRNKESIVSYLPTICNMLVILIVVDGFVIIIKGRLQKRNEYEEMG